MELKDLIGAKLEGFTIRELTEVYRTDDDGRRSASVGFFNDEKIAQAFAKGQKDANYHKTCKKLVLTDGTCGFIVGEQINLFDDEDAVRQIKAKALAKLNETERVALGL